MKFSESVVKCRIPILILTLALMFPALIGMLKTRVNYDMLTYLPDDMETVIGQNELLEDFGKGAFTFLIFDGMSVKEVAQLKEKVEMIPHVDTVLWYDSLFDISVPMELLPDSVFREFNTDHSTMMAVFFDSGTSDDVTMEAVREIRRTCGKQCFVSGMTALVIDLKDLCEKEEPAYVGLAVVLACLSMLLFLDGWLIPFVFLVSMGTMILLNLGTNFFFGEISYITKALSAVLQLAVTMDYSIFLWHSYNEQRETEPDNKKAMATAIRETFTSVIGSSVTTVAGFISLCFMSFTLGRDLGLVMAKGVLLGVLGCVTVLPSLILVMDRPLQKTKHRSIVPHMGKFAGGIIKLFPVFLLLFVLLAGPAYYGYSEANKEVYYDIGQCLPMDMDYVVGNIKMQEDFNIAATHMLLVDSDLSPKEVKRMITEMEQVDGVKYVLGLETVVGSRVPQEFLPESIISMLESDRWELLLINSEYRPASDAVNAQINELKRILKTYDESGMLIGEAPCLKDMIDTTDHDFKVVTMISLVAIFVIILLVEKSLTLPLILIAVIELGIFINLGLPHYLGQSMAFITPICISTIQLGATVDYAILMTTRYKYDRIGGADKRTAVWTALTTSIPSIVVSGMGMFAATFGVALYSDIEIVSSMCMLMARGALISMLLVIFILPAMLMLFDRVICKTTLGMMKIKCGKGTSEVSRYE